MNRKFRIGKGFTLIELLVVIAIIAILAAILFLSSPRPEKKRDRSGLPLEREADRACHPRLCAGLR